MPNSPDPSRPQADTPIVLITEPIAHQPLAWLGERCETQLINPNDIGFHEALEIARALVVRTYTTIDQAFLDSAPNLRVVARAGVGLDNIDLEACTRAGVRVVHTPRANAMAVVEYTISMLMRVLRPIELLSPSSDLKAWHALREAAITPGSVVGTPIGIVGCGYIGSRVARAAAALGMEVFYRDLDEIDSSQTHGAKPLELEQLLQKCQCICVHVDGRPGNHGLFDADAFLMMRDDAILINASRGMVVDPAAAYDFATTHPRSTLVLDVHNPEPITCEYPLLGLPNVHLTPHIAAATAHAKTGMSWVVRDVWAVLTGVEPEHPAN